jgi:drug/metabolite transporter (DMT)-like permease
MAAGPVVTALLAPWLTGGYVIRRDVVFGALVIPGIALVMGGIPSSMYAGFWVGILSAALSSLFVVLNKRHLGHHDALAVTWIEMTSGFLLIAILVPLASDDGLTTVPRARDAWLLAALALLCTLVPFTLSLATLRHLSAFTAQLAVNLEPIYSIAIAVAFLGEARDLTAPFFLGVATVMGLVFGHAYLQTPGGRSLA